MNDVHELPTILYHNIILKLTIESSRKWLAIFYSWKINTGPQWCKICLPCKDTLGTSKKKKQSKGHLPTNALFNKWTHKTISHRIFSEDFDSMMNSTEFLKEGN